MGSSPSAFISDGLIGLGLLTPRYQDIQADYKRYCEYRLEEVAVNTHHHTFIIGGYMLDILTDIIHLRIRMCVE